MQCEHLPVKGRFILQKSSNKTAADKIHLSHVMAKNEWQTPKLNAFRSMWSISLKMTNNPVINPCKPNKLSYPISRTSPFLI